MDELEFMASPIRIRDLKRIGEGRQAERFCWPQGKVVLRVTALPPDWKPLSCIGCSRPGFRCLGSLARRPSSIGGPS